MKSHLKAAFITGLLFLYTANALAQTTPDNQLEDAISALRNIKSEGMSDEQQQAKAKQIDDAWKYLIANGQKSAARLKDEIQKVDSGKEKDDFFKLNATVVLWNIGKFTEADYIANIWSTTPVSTQYTYVFLTAFEAAQSQDPMVLPMLRAILKDNKGSMFVGQHSMNVGWPLSHEFIWGAYGVKGLPVLFEILDKSNDPVELQSTMLRLTQAQYLPALPKVRQLALDTRDDVRRTAITCLGKYGHPNDYDFFINGLKSTNPQDLFPFAFALYEFDDERAVPHLIPLLKTTDDQVKLEVSLALLHLLTPESLTAVKEETAKIKNVELKKFIERSITLRQDKIPADYAKKNRTQQAAILSKIRNNKFFETPTDKKATNRQLHEALKEWKANGRIYGSSFEWIGIMQIIGAATADDLPMLIDTKSAFYKRLSDECLYETSDIDKAVKYIGRSRYRRGIGVTDKAELK